MTYLLVIDIAQDGTDQSAFAVIAQDDDKATLVDYIRDMVIEKPDWFSFEPFEDGVQVDEYHAVRMSDIRAFHIVAETKPGLRSVPSDPDHSDDPGGDFPYPPGFVDG